ncbi:MAG: zinc-finger domain-containing protein, partial [Roseinatronobacter sp.]
MTSPFSHDAPETEIVTAMRVCCDGGEGALGHPRVW